MKHKITKEVIRQLINERDLKSALEALNSIGIRDIEYANQAILLSNRFSRLTNDSRRGIISREDQEKVENEIVEHVLNLLTEIKIPDNAQGMLKSKSFIAKGKIDEAFQYLQQILLNPTLLNEIDELNKIYQKNERKARLNLVSFNEKQIQTNKIIYALLSIIDEIEENDRKEPIIEPKENLVPLQKPKKRKVSKKAKKQTGDLKKRIEILIIADNLNGAVEELNKLEIDNLTLRNERTMLNGRMNRFFHDKKVMSREDHNVTNEKLKRAVLYFVDRFEEDQEYEF